jgi:hypothetical protein
MGGDPDKMITIQIDRDDLGQILDGLDVLAQQWRDTLRYHEVGIVSECIRECTDADEARWIMNYYEQIISHLSMERERTR